MEAWRLPLSHLSFQCPPARCPPARQPAHEKRSPTVSRSRPRLSTVTFELTVVVSRGCQSLETSPYQREGTSANGSRYHTQRILLGSERKCEFVHIFETERRRRTVPAFLWTPASHVAVLHRLFVRQGEGQHKAQPIMSLCRHILTVHSLPTYYVCMYYGLLMDGHHADAAGGRGRWVVD